MVLLELGKISFKRNEQGELLAERVRLDGFEDLEVVIVPLTGGELNEIWNSKVNTFEQDKMVILKGCKSPVIDEKNITDLPINYLRAITKSIYRSSGVVLDDQIKKN